MVVRMRHTKSHRNNRRSHHKLTKPALTTDQSGGLAHRHRVSPQTGTYKGRQVIEIKQKKSKKPEKKAEGKSEGEQKDQVK